MKKWRSFASVLLVVGLLAGLLSACGGDEGVSSNSEVLKLKQENDDLQTQLDEAQSSADGQETSLRNVDGSSKPIFGTIDGQIKFPNQLGVRNGLVDVNDSAIRVGSKFMFSPSSNWVLKMDGTTLALNHPAQVWGNIKAVSIKEADSVESIRNQLESFYKGFPNANISYKNLFLDDRQVGMISSSPINVDRKKYVVNAGIIERGESALLLLFTYKDDGTGVQQELIDSLVTSGKFSDMSIKMD